METIIDVLASSYHWSKAEILNSVYLDEALEYIKLIKRRKFSDYLMQINIIANPHTKKPKELFDFINDELRKLDDTPKLDLEPEEGAFDKVRNILINAKSF